MTIKIAVINQKGGAGKTPVTINLAGALSTMGYKVLVVDLDGQGDLTTGLGFDDDVYVSDSNNIFTMLTERTGKVAQIIQPAPYDSFDVIPGNVRMYFADKVLLAHSNREKKLKRILDDPAVERYDFVLVDCPPNLGTVTDNALVACQRVLIPARMNTKNMRAAFLLLDQIRSLESAFDNEFTISILGIVPFGFSGQRKQKELLAELQEDVSFVTPIVRKRETVSDDAWDLGLSVFAYEPTRSYERKALQDTQEDYLEVARYIERHTLKVGEPA